MDYEDYLRVRKLSRWGLDHPRFAAMRNYVKSQEFETIYSNLFGRLNDEELANLAITLVNQTSYMLRKMLESQQVQFLEQGGVREQMTRARLDARRKS